MNTNNRRSYTITFPATGLISGQVQFTVTAGDDTEALAAARTELHRLADLPSKKITVA